MTDLPTAGRRVAALAFIPGSVAAFGTALVWASSHDPLATASTSSATTPSVDPALAAAQAKVDEAQQRLEQLRSEVEGQASAAASAASASASAAQAQAQAQAKAAAPAAKAPAPKAAAPKAAAAPAPPVQTTTTASRKR